MRVALDGAAHDGPVPDRAASGGAEPDGGEP